MTTDMIYISTKAEKTNEKVETGKITVRKRMEMNQELYQKYVEILKSELVPALGCTEPIALAYAAAVARKELGQFPEKVEVLCSGNIIKNVKGDKDSKFRRNERRRGCGYLRNCRRKGRSRTRSFTEYF